MPQPPPPPSWDPKRFQAYLAEAMREEFGTNKSKLSVYAGLHQATVSAWFSRNSRPSYDKLVQLAPALGVPLAELLEAAAYPITAADQEPEPDEDVRVPTWLMNVIRELDAAEMKTLRYSVEGTARGLLRLREERAPYGDAPESPEEPGAPTP